ncbi:MAG: hypothetical protein ACXABO_13080 [Promethearchaeota archaeon]
MRSDAEVDTFCTLCGMGIKASSCVAKTSSKSEKILYFCCMRCLSIYEDEIV